MKTYIGTKMVQAEPEEQLYDKFGRLTHRPGYKVVYPDGYVSWSPKAVFEEAYRLTDGMSFGLAIDAAKRGKKIRRRGWNGKKQYVELARSISYMSMDGDVVNAEHDAIGNQAFAFCGTSGVQMGWLASQADMLADDWEVAE